MGFYQPEWLSGCYKRKFRWKFIIPSICADGVFSLPPSKAARPNLTFKTMEAQHLNETVYYPAKPEWKPLQLQLYDVLKYDGGGNPLSNPIFSWIMRAYDPGPDVCGQWNPSLGDVFNQAAMPSFKAAYAFLHLYDGCGVLQERWVFEHVWPESVDWGDLNYAESDVVMCDLTLRYDRAFIDCALPSQWCTPFVPTFPPFTTDFCPIVATAPVLVPSGPLYCDNAQETLEEEEFEDFDPEANEEDAGPPDIEFHDPIWKPNVIVRSPAAMAKKAMAPVNKEPLPQPVTKRKFLVRK